MSGATIFVWVMLGTVVACAIQSIRWHMRASGFALREFNREAVHAKRIAGDWQFGALAAAVGLGIALGAAVAA